MNSIFSSFDLFSAELMGQKVRVSLAPSTAPKNNNNLQSQDSSKAVNMNQNKKHEDQSSSSKPRFALELDGLNCFETLVSY
ncbi:hypothetical protein ACOSP7_016708 [Xanthoceras sorbifolium]